MAEDQDEASKTEDPTQKKLTDSRKKGEVARSQEVNHFMSLLGGALFLLVLAPYTLTAIYDIMATFFERSHEFTVDYESVGTVMAEMTWGVILALSLPLALFVVMALASGPMQYGFLLTVEPMTPKLSKISVLKGLKRMFSLQQVMELVKGVVKISVVGLVAGIVLWPIMEKFSVYTGMLMGAAVSQMYFYALKVAGAVVFVMAVIALIDTVYQRFEYIKKQRMTKQEVKDEMKQAEGDPHIKMRLRRLRMERARQRMMRSVPKADVVITNPTHYAIALKYDGGDMEAPQVVAKGQDLVALRIRDLAFEHEVPVVENPPLARTLHAAYDIDDVIQPEHYQAVAEIISYVFKLNRKSLGQRPVNVPG
jgi:flagellar biosynthesis protein FlhB